MNMFRGLQLRALLIALFAFYLAPLLPLVVITSIPNFLGVEPGHRFRLWQSPFIIVLAWFYAIAPVGAAYLAAKLARQQPLLHGLVIGLVGAALVVVWVRGDGPLLEMFLAVRALLIILEPWASEVTLAPGESVWVVAEGAVPVGAHFDVESCGGNVVVTPEWAGAIANFRDSSGNKLD